MLSADMPTMRRAAAGAVLLALALFAAGCGMFGPRAEAPGPAWTKAGVVTGLRERYRKIRTLKDGDISLQASYAVEGGRQESPTMGGVLALDPRLPGLWLRAEALGQARFTLGVLKWQFWWKIPRTRELVVGGRPAFRKLPYVLRPQELGALAGSPRLLGLGADSTIFTVHPRSYVFDVWARPDSSRLLRTIYVDRRDLTVRRVRYYRRKQVAAEVRLDDYRPVGEVLLPHHLSLRRPRARAGMQLWLGEPEVNPVPPQNMRGFFETPGASGWRVINLNRQPLSDVKALQGEK